MRTHAHPSKTLAMLLIILLCMMSWGRGFWTVERNLHYLSASTFDPVESYCNEHYHCLVLDHQHLDVHALSETTHAFLHAIDIVEGKVMISLMASVAVLVAFYPDTAVTPSLAAPPLSPLYRPPRQTQI